jgi:polyhydroxyalkanoate synthesis repressor PhaR
VNLEEVAQMVRNGVDVQVVDASTGEDLTRQILTQIIAETAKEGDSALPLDMLRQMIMSSGARSQEALLKYMRATMEMYQNAYRAFTPGASPLDFMKTMMGTGWAPPAAAPVAPEPPSPPRDQSGAPSTEAPESNAEVDELRRRVEELEKRFAGSGRTRSPRNKPTRSRQR